MAARALATVVAAVVLATSCAAAARRVTGAPSSQAALDHTITGSIYAVVTGVPCPLHRGGPVLVYGDGGALLAQGEIAQVHQRQSGSVFTCRASFSVPVPTAPVYVVRVANGKASYSFREIVRSGWSVSLVAGQLAT